MSGQAGRGGGTSGGGENGGGGPDAELAGDVVHHLQSLGCFAEPSWVQAWLSQHRSGAQGGNGSTGGGGAQAQELSRLCLAHVLEADLRTVGAPALPPHVSRLHGATLPGQILLQVEEVSDIGVPVKHRYGPPAAVQGEWEGGQGGPGAPGAPPPSQRCLKLLLTDGHQSIAAFEYRHVPQLGRDLLAGSKVVLRDAAVRRGTVLLVPEVVQLLGGHVAHLEAARQRMLKHFAETLARPALAAERIQRQRQRARQSGQGQGDGVGGGGRGAQNQQEWAAAAVGAAWPEDAQDAAQQPQPEPQQQQQQQQPQQQWDQHQQPRMQQQQQQNHHQQPQPQHQQQRQQEQSHQQQPPPQQQEQSHHQQAQRNEHQQPQRHPLQRQPQAPEHVPDPIQHRAVEEDARADANDDVSDDVIMGGARQQGGNTLHQHGLHPRARDRVSRWLELAQAAQRGEDEDEEEDEGDLLQQELPGPAQPQGHPPSEAHPPSEGHPEPEGWVQGVRGEAPEALGSPPPSLERVPLQAEMPERPPREAAAHAASYAPAADGVPAANGAPAASPTAVVDLTHSSSQEEGEEEEEEGERKRDAPQGGEGLRQGEPEAARPGHTLKRPRESRSPGEQEEDSERHSESGRKTAEQGAAQGVPTPASEHQGRGAASGGGGATLQGASHGAAAVRGAPITCPAVSPGAVAGAVTGAVAGNGVAAPSCQLLYLADVLSPPEGQGAAHGPSAAGRRAEGGQPGRDAIFRVKCAVIGVKKVRPSGRPSITVYLDDGVTVAAATILPQETERIQSGPAGAPPAPSPAGGATHSTRGGSPGRGGATPGTPQAGPLPHSQAVKASPASPASSAGSQGRARMAHVQAFLAAFEGIAHVSASPTEDAALTIHRLSPGCKGIDLPGLLGRVRGDFEAEG